MRRPLVAVALFALAACSGEEVTGPDDGGGGGGGSRNSRSNPAAIGEAITSTLTTFSSGNGTVRLTLLSRVSGPAALDSVLAANQFNDIPAAGQEYILGRFRVEVVALQNPGTAFEMWDGHWESVAGSGAVYGSAFLDACCFDDSLEGEGFVGSSWDGWVAFLVATADTAPVAVYRRGTDAEAWFALR